MIRRIFFSLVIVLWTGSVQADPIAIVGGTVYTLGPQGTLDSSTLLIRDGKIEAIRSGRVTPQGYQVIDADGKVITPGFMESWSQLGLEEVQLSGGLNDASSAGLSVRGGH